MEHKNSSGNLYSSFSGTVCSFIMWFEPFQYASLQFSVISSESLCLSFFYRGKVTLTSLALNHCSRMCAVFGRNLTRLSFCRLFAIKPEMKSLNKNDFNKCSVKESRLGIFSCEIMTEGLE